MLGLSFSPTLGFGGELGNRAVGVSSGISSTWGATLAPGRGSPPRLFLGSISLPTLLWLKPGWAPMAELVTPGFPAAPAGSAPLELWWVSSTSADLPSTRGDQWTINYCHQEGLCWGKTAHLYLSITN